MAEVKRLIWSRLQVGLSRPYPASYHWDLFLASEPETAPQNIHAEMITPTTMMVSWSPPLKKKRDIVVIFSDTQYLYYIYNG